MEPDETDTFRIVAKIASSEIGVVAEPLSLHQMNKRDASMVHLAFTENDKSKPTRSSVLSSVLEIFRGADDDWEESAESELSGPVKSRRPVCPN